MTRTTTPLADLILIKPDVLPDERGAFFESYNTQKMKEIGIK